ncbi:MAG: SusC/RagA family TonB-linked outer membrane protein [Acidimicrobiia bacterium]|nr:SusC/RagA family TonB-linked outer membrane protein [Acidimicrobiia bacterium]
MRTNLNGILTLLLAFVVHLAFAQEKAISGTVTDQDGLPLPGVNIVIVGTTTGTQTDFDGNYAIRASEGQTLEFTYIGQRTVTAVVGASNTINIQMEEDAQALEEVVVTAVGIEREERSLGYSVTTVDEEQVTARPEADIARVLQGKVAGVNITANNGLSGSGTNIIIRGYSSVTQSNQPLFVVNGIPIDSGANTQSNFLDGNTESNRFLDLDPNSIESISVLKGLSATVLYGNRGRNGVILITTKGAAAGEVASKTEVSVTQSMFFSDAILPEYQNEYGGGFHQNFGFFFSNWGPRFDRTDNDNIAIAGQFLGNPSGFAELSHPLNFIADQTLVAGFEDIAAQPYLYKPYQGVRDFFRQGTVVSTSINVRGGGEKGSFNMNYGRNEDIGVTPGNSILRNNFSLGGAAKLGNGFSINGNFNFIRTDFKSPPNAASFGSGSGFDGAAVFGDVMYTPRSVDLTNLPFQAADGRSVYYRSGNDIQNPYWTVNNARTSQDVDRFIGNASVSYEFTDWLNLTYRMGLDTYTELNLYGQNRGGVDGDVTGILRTTSVRNTIWNHDIILGADRDISEDINLKAIAGVNSRRDLFDRDGIESTNQLVFGVLQHFNFTAPSSTNSFTGLPIKQSFEENLVGAYLDLTFAYKDWLFVNAVGRNDWSTTLESENNSLFYPGASISWVPTSTFPGMQGDAVNYLKLRLGYGSSAGFPTPFNTRDVLNLNARRLVDVGANVISSNDVSNVLGNRDLQPERIEEFEIGIDSRFFNRLNLNVSVFDKKTTDLITQQTLDGSTGFTSTFTNIGEIQSQGVEVDFGLDILKEFDNKVGFNLAGNFTAIETTVTQLDAENILLTNGVVGEAANYAVEGRPFGVLLGSTILRDDDGNRLTTDGGRYLVDNEISEIGDPNPDWTAALIPTVTFKNWTLSANLQYRHGGDIYSTTATTLIGRGVVAQQETLNREGNYILPGIRQSDGQPNSTAITATEVGFSTYLTGANELFIYDGSTIRLQEASLTYAVPSKMLDRTPFGSLSFSISGQNLWFDAVNFDNDLNYDTNASSTGVGNGQGIDFITGPSVRRYGFTVKASF